MSKHIVKFTAEVCKGDIRKNTRLMHFDFLLDSEYSEGLTMRFAELMMRVLRDYDVEPVTKNVNDVEVEVPCPIWCSGRVVGTITWNNGDYVFEPDFLDALSDFKGSKGERVLVTIAAPFVKDDEELNSEDIEQSSDEFEEEENLLENLVDESSESNSASSDDEEEEEEEEEVAPKKRRAHKTAKEPTKRARKAKDDEECYPSSDDDEAEAE